jgi:hypothetical protein
MESEETLKNLMKEKNELLWYHIIINIIIYGCGHVSADSV